METADIPQINLSKVGKKREKKKGALPWWLGGKPQPGSFLGAVGGSGAAGGEAGLLAGLSPELAAMLPKALVALLISAAVGGAAMVGRAFKPQAQKPYAPRPFAAAEREKAREAAASKNLPSDAVAQQSGLSMVSGSLGYGNGNAQSQGAGNANKAGDSGAAGQSDQAASAPAATPDPSSLVAAAAGKSGGAGGSGSASPFGNKIGSLSSSLGGGSGLSGGSGLFGGVGSKFGGPQLGQGLKAFAAAGTPSRQNGQAAATAPRTRGLAGSQLNRAVVGSRMGAQSATPTGAAYQASQPFDNGVNTTGMIGDQGGSETQGTPLTTSGGGGNSSNGGGGGGGGQPTLASGTGDSLGTTDDNCSQLLDSSFGNQNVQYENSASGGCVLTNNQQDISPWKDVSIAAGFLLMVASVLLIAASVCALISRFGGPTALVWWQMGLTLAKFATMVAAICTLLGVAMITAGNPWGGGAYTGVAAGVTALAAFQWINGDPSYTSTTYSSLTSSMTNAWANVAAEAIGAGMGGAGIATGNGLAHSAMTTTPQGS